MADSAVDAYISQIVKQNAATQSANQQLVSAGPTSATYEKFVDSNPTVLANYNHFVSNGKIGPGGVWADKASFGQNQYSNGFGAAQGYKLPDIATAGLAPFVSSDGKTFNTADDYRAYQTGVDQNTYNDRLNLASQTARNNVNQRFTENGLDPTQYGSQIDQYLNNLKATTGSDISADPTGVFGTNPGGDIISSLTSTARSQYGNSVNSTFTPNYNTTALDKNVKGGLTDTLNSILGQQSSGAQGSLDRALARKQINSTGYNAGETALGTQKTGALSSLNANANDVLSGYNDKLNTVEGSARSAATGYNLGSQFNLDDYTKQAGDVVNNFNTNSGGDLINAVGSKNLFDLSDIFTKAGTAQGPQNLGNLDVLDAVDRARKAASAGRGLGSQGAF